MIAALGVRALGALGAATSPPAVPDEPQANPGVWGFVITFLLALAVIAIIYDMIRRVRRMNYRAQARQELADEAGGSTEADALSDPDAKSDPSDEPPAAAPPTR